MGRLVAAGFDGDVLDFGTPARRAAVLDGSAVPSRWTPFDGPVDCRGTDHGCLVLGPDDVELLREHEAATTRTKTFVKALKQGRPAPRQGIAFVDGMFVWVTSEAEAEQLLLALHSLLFEATVRAVFEGRGDDANQLAWRLWRASVSVEEKAVAIAAMERTRYPQHAALVIGRPEMLSPTDRQTFEGVLFHARQGFDWAVRLCVPSSV